MLTTLTLGVVASLVTEIVAWINKKLTGTILEGRGAFLIAALCSLVVAAYQVVSQGVSVTDLASLGATFAQVWTVAQFFFTFIVKQFNLDIGSK